jgi:hypothetical protein
MEKEQLPQISECYRVPEINRKRVLPRLFARYLDNSIWKFFATWFFYSIFRDSYIGGSSKWLIPFENYLSNIVICLFLWTFVESFFIAKWGKTLGKWLFKIEVINPTGKITFSKALKRSLMVYFQGMALGIPIVQLFTWVFASNSVQDHGTTKWDDECGLIVDCQPMGWFRIIFNSIIIISVFAFMSFINRILLAGLLDLFK